MNFFFFFKVIFDKVILNTLIFAGQKAALAAAIHANPATVLWAILIQKAATTLFKKVKIPVARISKYHTEEAPRVID